MRTSDQYCALSRSKQQQQHCGTANQSTGMDKLYVENAGLRLTWHKISTCLPSRSYQNLVTRSAIPGNAVHRLPFHEQIKIWIPHHTDMLKGRPHF